MGAFDLPTPLVTMTLTERGLIEWARHRTSGATIPPWCTLLPVAREPGFGCYREVTTRLSDGGPIGTPEGYSSPSMEVGRGPDHDFYKITDILRVRWQSARGSWAEATYAGGGLWTLRVGGPPASAYLISALDLLTDRRGYPNEVSYPCTHGDFAVWGDEQHDALLGRLSGADGWGAPMWMRCLGRRLAYGWSPTWLCGPDREKIMTMYPSLVRLAVMLAAAKV